MLPRMKLVLIVEAIPAPASLFAAWFTFSILSVCCRSVQQRRGNRARTSGARVDAKLKECDRIGIAFRQSIFQNTDNGPDEADAI